MSAIQANPDTSSFVPCEHVDEIKAKLTGAGVMEADLGTADVFGSRMGN